MANANLKTKPNLIAKGRGWAAYRDPTWEGGVRLEVNMGPFGRESISVTGAIQMIARYSSAVAGADGWLRTVKWVDRKLSKK